MPPHTIPPTKRPQVATTEAQRKAWESQNASDSTQYLTTNSAEISPTISTSREQINETINSSTTNGRSTTYGPHQPNSTQYASQMQRYGGQYGGYGYGTGTGYGMGYGGSGYGMGYGRYGGYGGYGYGGYGGYGSYGYPGYMMGGMEGAGWLQSLHLLLASMGQLTELIGMNTQALHYFFGNVVGLVDGMLQVLSPPPIENEAVPLLEDEEHGDPHRREQLQLAVKNREREVRRLKFIRWAVILLAAFATYRTIKRIFQGRGTASPSSNANSNALQRLYDQATNHNAWSSSS